MGHSRPRRNEINVALGHRGNLLHLRQPAGASGVGLDHIASAEA